MTCAGSGATSGTDLSQNQNYTAARCPLFAARSSLRSGGQFALALFGKGR